MVYSWPAIIFNIFFLLTLKILGLAPAVVGLHIREAVFYLAANLNGHDDTCNDV